MNTRPDIHDLVTNLKQADEAFAIATVVRTVSITSAKAGAKAIIQENGIITEGWIGGGCARSAVLKAAAEALQDGTPRLVSIQPEDLLKDIGVSVGEEKDGIKFARNMCPSQGTMDVFVEPILPSPELVIFGSSPVAIALSNLSAPFGFSITVCALEKHHQNFHNVDKRINGFEFTSNGKSRTFMIIATQGSGDEAALLSAFTSNPNYLAFVGSAKKAESLKKKLQDKGIPIEKLSKLKAPAGLDIKAITPEEIALSILAEIIQLKRTPQRK